MSKQNLSVKVEKDCLVVRIPLAPKGTKSSTGKSFTIATTNGNQPTDCVVDGEVVVLGLNAYVKDKAFVKAS